MTNPFARRVTAKALYQSWFYAPRITAHFAEKRLRWLGFVWDGHRWQWPPVDVFMRQVMRHADD